MKGIKIVQYDGEKIIPLVYHVRDVRQNLQEPHHAHKNKQTNKNSESIEEKKRKNQKHLQFFPIPSFFFLRFSQTTFFCMKFLFCQHISRHRSHVFGKILSILYTSLSKKSAQ